MSVRSGQPRHRRHREIGAGQADEVVAMLERAELSAIERTRDYGGHERVVSGALGAS